MKFHYLALGALCALVPAAALADDPNDPAMRDPRARARDHELTRRLNVGELAYVRERDARYARGWQSWREYVTPQQTGDRSAREAFDRAHEAGDSSEALAEYARARIRYEHDLAAWRRAVAACQSSETSACD